MTSADLPNNNGDIRLATHTSAPPTESGVQGEIAYASDGYLYVHNGSSWVAQSGGTAVINLSCAWGTDYTAGVNHGWDGSCTPPSCPSGWTSVATYSEPLSVACTGNGNSCNWDTTASSNHPVAVGRSVRVCTK